MVNDPCRIKLNARRSDPSKRESVQLLTAFLLCGMPGRAVFPGHFGLANSEDNAPWSDTRPTSAFLHAFKLLSLMFVLDAMARGVADRYMGTEPVEHLPSTWTHMMSFPYDGNVVQASLPLYSFPDETIAAPVSHLINLFGQVRPSGLVALDAMIVNVALLSGGGGG